MANVKISNLTAATTPVAGTEVLPIVQSNATVKVSIANLTAGRSISATGLALAGSTSGTVTLAAKAVAGSTTFRLPAADGTSNQAMVTDGSGNLSFATIAATPGGSTTQLQYNNAGAFGGISGVTTDGTRMTASTTIGVGAATPSTSGAGITFPATQSASSNANTLDDYEEGTWTPTLTTTGTNFTSVTYNASTSGKYTKIGNMVYVQGLMETTAVTKGSASGFPLIGGLPFSKASDNQFGMFAAMQRSGWSTNVPNTGIVSATTIYLQYTTAANGATSYSAISDISTTSNLIYFGACYNV